MGMWRKGIGWLVTVAYLTQRRINYVDSGSNKSMGTDFFVDALAGHRDVTLVKLVER
jgi:hypothetical protein